MPRFITKKWIEVHDQSGNAEDGYKPSQQIRFKTSLLRLDLCDFSDACIVVKRTITVTGTDNKSRKDSESEKTQSLLNTRQVLQGVLTMLMKELPTEKIILSIILLMMWINLVKKKLKLLFH